MIEIAIEPTALHELTEQGLAIQDWPDNAVVCRCRDVSRGELADAVLSGHASLGALGHCTGAGTEPGCQDCHARLGEAIAAYRPRGPGHCGSQKNKIETLKLQQDGLECMPDVLDHAERADWQGLSADDQARFKWHGLFFRKQTPGHFMLRIRATCGFATAEQFRTVADLSDQYGKGFCDLTTRQQLQMRWFQIQDMPAIWDRLAAVGLTTRQTGMDNIRGVCGCPVSGLTPHEHVDASAVARAFTEVFLDNKEFTNLPRKFNVTITGCLENCCHAETQDLALVPSSREDNGVEVRGFNVLVGGKQGSGGYTPAEPLDVFVTPEQAPLLCAHLVRIFRDHGGRESRTRARLAFLVQDLGLPWLRAELERRCGWELPVAGPEVRKKQHVDHLGIHPQARTGDGPALYYAGLLVPVGRITTDQMRGVADLAERYGNGEIRLTVQQNVIVPNIPEDRLDAFRAEPLLKELQPEPSPIMRGLVSCVGSDYCHLALIETKGWAIEVARELEQRCAGRKVLPLTIHWSGCSAGCGLHQTATIGLQGCRTRQDGKVVDAAHVCVQGRSGPDAQVAHDLMYDVPCSQLASALEPLVNHLPRRNE